MSCQRPREHPTDRLTPESGRYLLELYVESAGRGDRIQTGTVAARLDVQPASVTEMVSKLAKRGLVDHRKHEGARLTPAGEELAAVLAWRYCVTERFLVDELAAAVDRETVYRIGFELPADGLVTLAELVDIPCLRACPRADGRPRARSGA